ncbi:hypothetical protein BDA99DRAFT_180954 [Phascolomyces articulosus]|uniref:Uncharacterized protein n=1 Tax=Phascolomyces articulosus TaxID=60185 RepID=A0AAD5JSN2_9FUNG|nr:hypothetical protein BDA99DRAFT_180954 [Phascolomyces articulosus]
MAIVQTYSSNQLALNLVVVKQERRIIVMKETKEKFESNLKDQKTMEDMLQLLLASFSHAKGLVIVGYAISELKIFALLLDHPSPYVCRPTRATSMYFPDNVEQFSVFMGSIINFILQTKQVVHNTLKAKKKKKPKTIQTTTVMNSSLGIHPHPTCATSPNVIAQVQHCILTIGFC